MTCVAVLSCTGREIRKSTELRFGFTSEPTTLDPLNRRNTADGRSILFNVFEGLVRSDVEGNLQPGIAESWTIEQNGLVYNFTIREGVRFHDGSVLTAADVKFSLQAAAASGFHSLDRIERIEAIGESQVRITLNTPDYDFLPYLTIGIVPAGNTEREINIIGTGPFFIESYRPQRDIVLRRFDDYWQHFLPEPRKTYLEKVTIVFFANSDAMMLALRGGSIDGASITGSLAAQLDTSAFDIFHNNSAAVQFLALNNAVPPLDDLRVRKALNYGIDIQGIIDTAFFGMGTPSGSPLIPGLSAYYEAGLSYPHNPDIARSLLAEAGFGANNGADRRLSLEITAPSNFTMHVDTAQVVANQLANIGVDVSIRLVDWATWLNDVYFGRQYMATIISVDSPNVSPISFLNRYHSQSSRNFIHFSNADFDMVYSLLINQPDRARRVELIREAQRIITENAASVFIQDIYHFKAFRGGVYGGVLNYPLYVIDFASIYGIKTN